MSDRAEKHGAVRKTFENLALQWSAFLRLLGHPVHLKASEAAEMMQLLKTVRRHNGTHNEDDDIDNIAYGGIVAYLRAIEEEERLGTAEARIVAAERASKKETREMTFPSAAWSDERVERLKVLYADNNRSCSRIALALNREFPGLSVLSRNAVIGKVARMGLPLRGQYTGPRTGGGMPKPRTPREPKPEPLTASQIEDKLAGELPPTDDPYSAKGCRWPIGEPGAADFRFCQRPCGKRADGCESSWCEGHHALGTRRPKAWERDAGRRPSGKFAENVVREESAA